MPPLSPWIYLGVVLALVAVGGGGYWKGSVDGANSVKADLADDYRDQLVQFNGEVQKAAAAATANALRDFAERMKIADDIVASITKAQGAINAASSRLAASFKNGACVLSPDQRRLFECMRRPGSAGCNVPAPDR
jgi:predicted NUDIX family NTP pyrophosphohydrolase